MPEITATTLQELAQTDVALVASLRAFNEDVRSRARDLALAVKSLRDSLEAFYVFRAGLRWDDLPPDFVFPNVKAASDEPLFRGGAQLTKAQIDLALSAAPSIIAACLGGEQLGYPLAALYTACAGTDATIAMGTGEPPPAPAP